MIPARNRLSRSGGFDDAIRRGRRFGDRRMVVHYLAAHGASEAGPLVGVTVAKRQIPLASGRNRLKRQLRHLLSDRLGEIPAGSKVVVRVLRGAEGASSEELGSSLDRLLARAMGGVKDPAAPRVKERK